MTTEFGEFAQIPFGRVLAASSIQQVRKDGILISPFDGSHKALFFDLEWRLAQTKAK